MSAEDVTEVKWEDSAAFLEAADVTGEFSSLYELGLAIWIPTEMAPVEVSEEDAQNGRLYLLMDANQSCYLTIDAVHKDGMTQDEAYDNAVANGMESLDRLNVNGLSAISYKNTAANLASFVLVDTNSNAIIFSFSPVDTEIGELLFTLICSSIMPLE